MIPPLKTSPAPLVHQQEFHPISPKTRQTLSRLFQEMDTHTTWQLMTNASRLKDMGDQLRKDVHPLQLLMEIFADTTTRKHFESLYQKKTEILSGKQLVWSNFVLEWGENLNNHKEELEPYLVTFAKTMKISPLLVRSHLQEHNYNGLISSILEKRSEDTTLSNLANSAP